MFAIADNPPALTRQQLLSAAQLPQQSTWRVTTASGPLLFRMFSDINEEHYSTYLKVS